MIAMISRVRIPAMSTIGFLDGFDEDGNKVTLACDHRSARYIGQDVEQGELVEIEPDISNGVMVLSVHSPKEEDLAQAELSATD